MELEWVPPDHVLGVARDEIEELWRRVFPETTDERFAKILPRHARRRGFVFLAARTAGRRLAGFAYGYQGAPGEWWHDQVAAAMTDEQRRQWLPEGHFEFVELIVAPELEGQGMEAACMTNCCRGSARRKQC